WIFLGSTKLTLPVVDVFPLAPARGDRIATVAAEAAWRDPDADRALPALVFADLDQLDHALHRFRRQAHRDDLGRAHVALDVRFEDRIELVVRRKAVLVGLVGAQLRRRR